VFNGLRAKFAVKNYARKLPAQLARDYRKSETYGGGQIRRAVVAARLNPKFLVLGYAAFLPKALFDELRPSMPIKLEYEEARILFLDAVPIMLVSTTSPAPQRDGVY
jgi:hypothetical protein